MHRPTEPDKVNRVGVIRDLFTGRRNPLLADAETGPHFAIDADSIDPAVFGLSSYISPLPSAARISRREAMQVPAVKRTRDLIATTLGSLPIDLFGPDKAATPWNLLTQPELNRPRSVSMTQLFEDLLFEGRGWWKVTKFGWHGYPVEVERIEPRRVALGRDSQGQTDGKVYIDGRAVNPDEMIRFDSPNDGLLVAGSRAIRACLHLDMAAGRFAEGTPPIDYFTPADGIDPAEDAEVEAILTNWKSARQTRGTAYVPSSLKYNVAGWNPEQLQLADARQHAVLEIARIAGVDAEELGVSTTSRTYNNQFDRRKAFLDFTLGGYVSAMQDRLSMTDVTPRGYTARINLDAFLRSDTKTRYETYEIGLRVGAITPEEIRTLEDKEPATERPASPQEPTMPAAPPTMPVQEPMMTADTARPTFDTGPAIRLDSPQSPQLFQVDVEQRTIRGLAVPYGKPGKSMGRWFRFSKGTLKFADPTRVKLWIQHDPERVVGVATAIEDRDDGLYATFKIGRGPEGDRAIMLAEDGILDGLSIGLAEGGRFTTAQDGISDAVTAPLMEISLTPAPSFDDARVHAVAASATLIGGKMTPEQRARYDALKAKTDRTAEESAELETLQALADAADNSNANSDASNDFSAVSNAIRAGFDALRLPARESVNPSGGVEVTEPPCYRFDGIAGAHSFTEDLRSANFGDSEARQRIDEFFGEAFAVTTTNVAGLNPSPTRPELYVPQLSYSRPLWEAVSTGSIDDKTPFIIPKFSSASGLVGAHTEGTEPTPGAFAATTQTVTPTATSGKVEINREVLDQGGSPQADQIIWNEMLNGWFEAIEAKIATVLAAVGTAELNLASAVDTALVDAVTNYFAGLQFVRGGNRFTALVLDGKLFPALIDAADGDGRKLLPVLGPTNAQGQTAGAFDRVSLGGVEGRAAWALGSTDASKSYNFVPSSVYAWASAPKRFTFEYQVKSVDMAIWGYTAAAVTRDSDVKPIDYTTAD